MGKPEGMSSREYYHYKRLGRPERYAPLGRACKKVTDFQGRKDVKTVIDLGSSCGPLLQEIQASYNTWDVYGVDISEYAEKHWVSKGRFIKADLNESLDCANVLETVGKVDLILSFETAEHLTNPNPLLALTALLAKEDSVMIFGAASPYQASSKGHVTCRWPKWWMKEFSDVGWTYDHLSTTRFAYYIGMENGQGNSVPEYYLNALVFRRTWEI